MFDSIKTSALTKEEQRIVALVSDGVRQYVEKEIGQSRKEINALLRKTLLEIYKEQERISQSLLQSGTIPYSASQTSKLISAVLGRAIRNR